MSAGRNGTGCGSDAAPERAQGPVGGEDAPVCEPGPIARAERYAASLTAALARLAEFAAQRAELAAEEAEYLAELARTADPGLAGCADPSVHASVTTGFHPAAPEPREFLTQIALADMLDTHPRTIRRMELAGELPDAMEIGRLKRWRRSTVQAWLDEGCPKPRRKRR